MNISVLTPDKEIFYGSIKSVKVPGTMGQFQVLNNHAPIVASLEKGTVELVTAEGEHRFFNAEAKGMEAANETNKLMSYEISGGFIEVLNNEISLLVTGI